MQRRRNRLKNTSKNNLMLKHLLRKKEKLHFYKLKTKTAVIKLRFKLGKKSINTYYVTFQLNGKMLLNSS